MVSWATCYFSENGRACREQEGNESGPEAGWKDRGHYGTGEGKGSRSPWSLAEVSYRDENQKFQQGEHLLWLFG